MYKEKQGHVLPNRQDEMIRKGYRASKHGAAAKTNIRRCGDLQRDRDIHPDSSGLKKAHGVARGNMGKHGKDLNGNNNVCKLWAGDVSQDLKFSIWTHPPRDHLDTRGRPLRSVRGERREQSWWQQRPEWSPKRGAHGNNVNYRRN